MFIQFRLLHATANIFDNSPQVTLPWIVMRTRPNTLDHSDTWQHRVKSCQSMFSRLFKTDLVASRELSCETVMEKT